MTTKASDARLTNLFLDMLAAEQGAGDNTLDAYRGDLEDFSNFLTRAGQGFADADTQVLRDYLSHLDARGFKSSSVARRLSAMRHLFRFLLNERIRGDDPAAILSGPKRGRSLPKVLSIADVDRLLTRAKTLIDVPKASAGQRIRAMRLYCLLEVLYATGLRVSELVGGATRRTHDRGARQGQQGTAGAAQRNFQAGDGRLPCRHGSCECRKRKKTHRLEMAVPVLRRERPSDAAAFRP
jgi:site-specific recombinase XerD